MHAHWPSCVLLFATPWTVTHQALLSIEFSRQEYWSGLPLPTPGDLPDPGIEPASLAFPALVLTTGPPRKSRAFNSTGHLTQNSWLQSFQILSLTSAHHLPCLHMVVLKMWSQDQKHQHHLGTCKLPAFIPLQRVGQDLATE